MYLIESECEPALDSPHCMSIFPAGIPRAKKLSVFTDSVPAMPAPLTSPMNRAAWIEPRWSAPAGLKLRGNQPGYRR